MLLANNSKSNIPKHSNTGRSRSKIKCKNGPREFSDTINLKNHEDYCQFGRNSPPPLTRLNPRAQPFIPKRFKCNFCEKTFAKNGKFLQNHEAKHSNGVEFSRNNLKFSVNQDVKNLNSNDINFLKDFNLTLVDRNTRLENLADQSMIFLDTGFSGVTNTNPLEKCLYESTVSEYLNKFRNNLKIRALNINSLAKKFEDVLFLLNRQFVDVLVIGESKLNSKHDESEFEHPCYDIYRLDRLDSGGGGVLVFVKKNLFSSHVIFDPFSEMISFLIKVDQQKIGIIASYRPPYQDNVSSFFKSLNNQLNCLETLEPTEVIIAGDLNFDMLDTKKSYEIFDFISTKGFANKIRKPTRLDL